MQLFYRILIGVFIIVVLIIAVIQYLDNQKKIEIKVVASFLDYCHSIYRTMTMEFELDDLLLKITYDPELLQYQQRLSSYIENLIKTYNSYNKSNYIIAVGYYHYPEFNKHKEYNNQTEKWGTNPILAEQLEKMALSVPKKALYNLQFLPNKLNNLYHTIFILSKESELMVTITFDISLFYKNLIIPIIKDKYPLVDLRLIHTGELNHTDIGSGYFYSTFDYKSSVFNLLSADNNKHRWLIPLPRKIFPIIRLEKNEEQREKAVFKYLEEYLKNFDNKDDIYAFLDIQQNDQTVFIQLEQQLFVNWLIQLLLLTCVGAAFILLLLQLLRMQKQRLREKEFVASVTHELKTPLAIIKSAAENIKRKAVPAKRLESYGKHLLEQTKRLTNLMEEILLFSRLETHDHRQRLFTVVNLHKILKQIIKDMSTLTPNPTIVLDMASLPQQVKLDVDSFNIIIRNIILNAQTHAYPAGQGGIIRITAWLKIPNNLAFTIEDEGTGIHRSELAKIFQPFYRCRKSRAKQVKGSGLGLFLAYKKARLMHGTLKVSSPYIRKNGTRVFGCRFTLQLPYLPPYEQGESE